MITERNLTYLYVGNVAHGIGAGATLNVDAMANGSVAVVNVGTGRIQGNNALTAGNTYQIVNKLSDGTVVRSPKVRPSQIVMGGLFAYSAPVEQVSYLGYDGTTFSGIGTPVIGDNYIISIWLNNTRGVYAQEAEKKIFSAQAKTATQLDLVNDLIQSASAVLNEPHNGSKIVSVERTGNVTGVVAFGGTGVLSKFTKGSNIVTFHTVAEGLPADTNTVVKDVMINVPSYKSNTFELTITQANTTVVIDGVRHYVAAENSANATATTIATAIAANPVVKSATAAEAVVTVVYKEGYIGLPPAASNVTTIAGGDAVSTLYKVEKGANGDAFIELDVPWEGPTGYVYTKANTTGVGVATVGANSYALKFSGVEQPFTPQTGYPAQVNFDVLTDAFGYVREYKAFSASPGTGDWKGLAELEAYTQGNEVWYRNSAYPATNYRREIKKGGAYNVITLVAQDTINISTTGTNVTSPFTFTIAIDASLANYGDLDRMFA